jgi:hypothetical protein
MATRSILTPCSAEFPSSNFPQLGISNASDRRPVIAYDGTTAESAYWTIVAPQGLLAPLTIVLSLIFPTAISGTAIMDVAIEAISTGDAVDLDSSSSFATTNTSGAISAPGTAGFLVQSSISLTNDDAISAADYVRLRISRAPANASDTITTDLHLLLAELRDAA